METLSLATLIVKECEGGGLAGGFGLGSWLDGVSGWIWYGLGGKMGSFGISWIARSGGWEDESFMPVLL
jgi:hypothetical protein